MECESLCIESFHQNILKSNALFEMLDQFSTSAEKFNFSRCDQDVITEYLKFSPDCYAFMSIIKRINETSAKDVSVLFKAITCILARVATDLNSYSALGTTIVGDVLKYCLKVISNFLRDKKKPARIRITLNLVAAMVVQGKVPAQDVFSKINFAGPNVIPLFHKSNPEEEEDVRALLLNIVILLLSVGDNNLVRQIVEAKGFLNSIFPNITSDRPHLIVAVLDTLEKKVLKSPNIVKSSKIKLFNDFSLKFVLKLYSWSGPVKLQISRKRKLGEDIQSTSMECSTEDVKSVTRAVNSFLATLCCSYKYGIIFRDWSFGTSGSNQNHVLTNLLNSFENPHCNPHMRDFIVSVLKTCLDQRKYFLVELKDSFYPRKSDAWFNAISMLKTIVESGDYITNFFKLGEKKPLPKLIAAAKAVCLPEVINLSIYQQSFLVSEVDVCYALLEYLHSALKEVEAICSQCKEPANHTVYSQPELEEFSEKFVSSITELIPSDESLRALCSKTFDFITQLPAEECVEPQLGFALLLLYKIIDIYTLYRQLKILPPSTVGDSLLCLLEGFGSIGSCFESNERRLLQLQLVQALSEIDSVKSSSSLQNTASTSFSYAIDGFLEAHEEEDVHKATQVAFSVFKNVASFDGEEWEADVWLGILKNQKSSHQKDLGQFLSECLHVLQSQERSVIAMETDVSTRRLSYSQFVPIVLECLKTCTVNAKACRRYVQSVLNHIFHHQVELNSLFCEVTKYEELFSKKNISYWRFLADFGQDSVVEDFDEHVEINGAFTDFLQETFLAFHSHSKKSKKNRLYVYESLKNDLARIKMEEIPHAIWQLLLYTHLEAKRLFDNPKAVTAIPSYISIIKELLLNFVDSKGSTLDDLRSTKLSLLLSDFLSHPGITKCFLPLAHFENRTSNRLESLICDVTSFVFEILGSSTFQPYFSYSSDTLGTLKTATVQFFGHLSSGTPDSTELSTFFKAVVTKFSSIFNAEDVITLLSYMLSVTDDQYGELDPDFKLLSLLTKNDCLQSKYHLLSDTVLNSIVKKCFQQTLKKKHKKVLRDIMEHLLQRHPECSLSIKTDCAVALLEQSSVLFLKTLTFLLDNNQKIRSKFQKYILKQMDTLDETSSHQCLIHTAIQCFKFGNDDIFLQSTCQYIWNYIYMEFIANSSLDSNSILEDVPWITAQLIEKQLLEETAISDIEKTLMTCLPEEIPHPSKVPTIIKILQSFHQCPSTKKIDPSSSLLQLVFVWLEKSLVLSQEDVSQFFTLIMDFVLSCLQNSNDLLYQKVIKDIKRGRILVYKFVEMALSDTVNGGRLLDVASCLLKKLHGAFPDFVTGTKAHQDFIPPIFDFNTILQNEDGNFSYLKGHIIHFLASLFTIKLSIVDKCSSSSILSTYSASLSEPDQETLFVLKMYDEQSSIPKRSILWGSAAISNYDATKDMHVLREPKMQTLLGLFHHDYLDYTVLHFPLNLSFEITEKGSFDFKAESSPDVNWHKVYDPRFLLNVVSSVLSPGSFVNCKDFIDSSVLPVVFACLSSNDKNIRAQAYYCLSRFYNHLESSTYAPRKLWISFLDQLRNSVETSNVRVPFIISLFFAKSVRLLRQPDGRMYVPIYQFLTIKPCLDIGQVPEFYKLFNSCDVDYRIQRNWLLNLLAEGLRTSLDFHLCQKRYIFTLLLPYFSSSISTEEEKLLIIRILLAAVRIPSSARTLCQLGLINWLDNVIILRNPAVIQKAMSEIMQSIYRSYINTESCTKSTMQKFQFVRMNLSIHMKEVPVCLANPTTMTKLSICRAA